MTVNRTAQPEVILRLDGVRIRSGTSGRNIPWPVVSVLLACVGIVAAGTAGTAERWEQTVGGVKNTAWYQSAPNARGAVLLVHGSLGFARMETLSGLQDALAERGLASLSISLSYGVDRRDGVFECDAPIRHGLAEHMTEIDAWRDHLTENGDDLVGVFGHSRGGNQVLHWAETRDWDAPVVLLAPATADAGQTEAAYDARSDVPLAERLRDARDAQAEGGDALDTRVFERAVFLGCDEVVVSARAFLAYYGDAAGSDTPTQLRERESTSPTLILIGSEDTVVADLPEKLEGLDRAEVSVQTIEGADHFFRDFFAEDVADAMDAFLR